MPNDLGNYVQANILENIIGIKLARIMISKIKEIFELKILKFSIFSRSNANLELS